ncbi:hypothetical protein F5Y14DRAFT_104806 [Nemania sp. NC0429]|nr:hypothetical protein F5Y14DRAFT_104806 [Nemania sp. NC0429]
MQISSLRQWNFHIIHTLERSAGSGTANKGAVVYASSTDPQLGRQIFCPGGDGHYTTAGVVVEVGEEYYQLTASHLFEFKSEALDDEPLPPSLDECHFDGQSADEELDSDDEVEVTGRGSATPEDAESQDESSSDSTNEKKNESLKRGIPHNPHPGESMESQWYRTKPAISSPNFPIGRLPRDSPARSSIDYAMIALPIESVSSFGNKINGCQPPSPLVTDVAKVGHEECSIIVVTSSTIIEGTLIPGGVAHRGPGAHQFERLVQIVLELELFEGDCGSPVLNRSTGSLYGHIVMGVAGTKVAYIVQAVDIFQDIATKTGEHVKIADREGTKDKAPLLNGYGDLLPQIRARNTSTNSSFYARSRAYSISCAGSYNSISSHTITSSAATASSLANEERPRIGRTHRLPCEFVGYTGCEETFGLDEFGAWVDHIVSEHLLNLLPKKVICWFCDDEVFDCKRVDRETNFRQRMWHIRGHFQRQEFTLHDIRPDHHLNKHLWEKGLISKDMYTAAQTFSQVPDDPWIPPLHNLPDRSGRAQIEYANPHDEVRVYRRHRDRGAGVRH